jgi:hypothetical protein
MSAPALAGRVRRQAQVSREKSRNAVPEAILHTLHSDETEAKPRVLCLSFQAIAKVSDINSYRWVPGLELKPLFGLHRAVAPHRTFGFLQN